MEILEVAENVAQYLDKKDKAACLHVCKTWYRHILSSLYHTVEAPYNSVLSLEALLLHGHRIRHLNLGRHLVSHFHPQLEFYSHHRNLIPNLTELTISLSAIQRDDDRYAWLAVFIAVVNSGRKLRKLTLEDEKQNPSPRPCWTYLFSQFDPHQTVLEELKLRYIYLNDEEETRLISIGSFSARILRSSNITEKLQARILRNAGLSVTACVSVPLFLSVTKANFMTAKNTMQQNDLLE
ncbi:hypothetical protein BGZ83_005105 [Gryganskiella cystojenkinii]|nr:hypothetical protein BGZ83_005105 [Gryganskiella cystojenkinii]